MSHKLGAGIAISIAILITLFEISGEDLPTFRFKEEKAKDYLKAGMIYLNSYQYSTARENFIKALSEKKDFNLARKNLARAYYFGGEWSESLSELEILENQLPRDAIIRNQAEVLRLILGGNTKNKKRTFYKTLGGDEFRGYRFRNPVDAIVDPEGFLYILSFETANIVKFNPNGMPVANFRGGLGRTLEGPLFFTLYNKYLYVSDFKSDRIYIISDTGSFESRFGETGREPGKFHGPSGIAISPNAEIYVSDSGNNRIQKFNMTGKFIQEFGLTGNGKLNNPTGLAIDNRNEIFVIDKENKRVVIFDDEGNFLREISHKNMKKPHSIKFHEGRIYIADEENGLMIYNAEEDKWTRLSSFMDDTGKFRKLDRPFSTAYDSSSSLYTVDYERHRVDIFSPKNTLSSNLNLSLEHVDTSRFPDVSLTLHVKNRTDLDITGINRTAFRIFENDNPVPLPGLFNMKKINDRISISLVFENSKKINEFSKTLVEYGSLNALKTDQTLENSFLGKFFKSFTKLDKIEVIRSGKDSLRVYEYGYSMLDVFARIRKSQPEKEINLGKGIYQGITDLLPELGPRALFILVSGNSLPEAFNQYSINRNIQYANSHSIPIYILALSENPETSEFYKDMARRTGGKYIIVPGSVEEKTLYDTVMSKKDTRYILSFKSGIKRDFAGRYIGLKFDVNYRGVMGKSEGGFFVPENQ